MDERGFTLIEVLIVCAILFVLAGIAIPQFRSYRALAFDRTAQVELRAVAVAEEAYFVDNDNYVSCTHVNCANLLTGVSPSSPGVTLQISSTATGFSGSASHDKGTGRIFNWN